MTWRSLVILAAMLTVSACSSRNATPFPQWVAEFRAEAITKGIPASVADEALADIQVDESVVELDQKQPEDKATFTQYLNNTVTKKRIQRGRGLLAEHKALLEQISAKYHVQPQYIVALWGMESDYGKHQGKYNVVQSLATLAYDGRRADFFRSELLNSLRIMANRHVPVNSLTGSWAGAMGNCQFMPSSYLRYAVDEDGNGRADIWNSLPDTFASIANYLHQSGWNDGVNVAAIATADAAGELVTPGSNDEGVYAVTSNYRVLLKWNRSRYFAISVGTLADALVE